MKNNLVTVCLTNALRAKNISTERNVQLLKHYIQRSLNKGFTVEGIAVCHIITFKASHRVVDKAVME